MIAGPDTVDDFPENSATSRQVGRYTATDPEGATVTLGLSSGDADFTLASNGVLTFKESPDFEDQHGYTVTVEAEVGIHTGSDAVLKTVNIDIQNLEESGTVLLSTVQPQADTLLTATLGDDDNPTGITWQWYRTSSRVSTGTAITNATSPTYTPDADDVGLYLRATASYDDGHGMGKTAVAVSANRVQAKPPDPEAPVFPADGDYDRSIRENTRAGTNLGAPVRATDGNNDRLTYSIPASDYIEIDASSGQLRTKVELDHEDQATRTIAVTATDPGGLSTTPPVTVTVTVEDVDETPVVSGTATLEVVEGTSTGTILATYTVTDPDQEGIEWVLTGSDSDAFTLSGGVLTFNEVPDYEEKSQYRITIEAHEQGDGTSVARLNVTVRVTNVDEPGVVQANAEEPRVGQTLRLNVEDEDGGETVSEWKWEKGVPNSPCGTVDSPTVTNWETIPRASGSSYTPMPADQGHCIRVTVIYNDRAGTGRSEQFLTTESVEFGPFFTQDPPTFSVREHADVGTTVGSQVTARHSNSGETLTYSLNGSSDFDIDQASGQIETTSSLDYESQKNYELEVTATDNSDVRATITVTISVTDECQAAGEPPCAPRVSPASATSLRVSWSAPSADDHDLQYREAGSNASWTQELDVGASRSHTISGLTTGTEYEVQVRTVSGGTSSAWSRSGTGTPGATTTTTTTTPTTTTTTTTTTTPTTTTTTTTTGGGGGGGGRFVPPAPSQPPRPVSNFQGVGQLFQPLTRNATLGRVWRLIESSQRWLFYDPDPQFAPFNTLRTVNLASDPPAVLVIGVTRSQQFRGVPLYVGWNFVSVTAEPLTAQPGSGTQPVSQLFRPLANSGVLQRVWWLDSRTQEWKFYDPDPQFTAFNTLTTIDMGASLPVVLAVGVDRRTEFRGRTLYRGWNYVVMR